MNNFIQNYEIILEELQKIEVNFSGIKQIRKPRLSNLELIAMNLTSEYMSIDSECHLFRIVLGTYLEDTIERSVYNKRKLFPFIEQIKKTL